MLANAITQARAGVSAVGLGRGGVGKAGEGVDFGA
jgi:hypothetical protein